MKRICIAAGGTGGHIYPALALAQSAMEQDPDTRILFIGNADRMEARIVPEAGFDFAALDTHGLEGSLLDKVKAAISLMRAIPKAGAILDEFRPDIVVGFGGYVSAPVLRAAHARHIPVMMHEQNSIAGKANKVTAGCADEIVTCYEKAGEQFPAGKVKLLGNPRGSVAASATGDRQVLESLGLDPSKKTILVMMGSLGSTTMNDIMQQVLARPVEGLQFLFVTGRGNEDAGRAFDGRPDVKVVPYVDTLAIYPFISGMICRAGATTIAELTARGIPAILVPSPYVAGNHQFYNASVLKDAGAAQLVEEKTLLENPEVLRDTIRGFFGSPMILESAAKNAARLGKPQAAADMLQDMHILCGGSR
ncbi:undecaprenyldiphospho-muramoylpentapeptide beta-N-acetylglucosaminyltransferase [Faecalibaculum rodentium]|uniref:undecaprenyldiphospho-muramoylpentapeptide beta-N-acetylglucosaminyltransferase n=1 Tax=Faecalibaculum rodentium TaxID=1702221 RepID=UPI0023EFC8DF|nr:undecaprenyldiphospho-muramoylpentapeptide beta-N-acetylglucosaminyltransferase [Faecalibaculum rodentium]